MCRFRPTDSKDITIFQRQWIGPVRLLRKKLGPHAADIETVKGHGFRIAQRNSLET